MSETYVSLDVETTGPVPGLYSMLSLGAAAYTEHGEELARWTANLAELPGSDRHPDTMAWWSAKPEAWQRATADQRDPADAMNDFVRWVEALPGQPLAVGTPAAFDFAYVNWYCWRFCSQNPLGFDCLDLRSLAMGLTYSRSYYDLRESEMRALRAEVDRDGVVEHVALDDAVGQGRLLVAMLARTKGEAPSAFDSAGGDGA